jgi:hypothetical protein
MKLSRAQIAGALSLAGLVPLGVLLRSWAFSA